MTDKEREAARKNLLEALREISLRNNFYFSLSQIVSCLDNKLKKGSRFRGTRARGAITEMLDGLYKEREIKRVYIQLGNPEMHNPQPYYRAKKSPKT